MFKYSKIESKNGQSIKSKIKETTKKANENANQVFDQKSAINDHQLKFKNQIIISALNCMLIYFFFKR